MNKLYRATKLELSSLKERKLGNLFFLLIPSLIVLLFFSISNKLMTWGEYASLNIRMYDIYAPYVVGLILIFVTVQLTVLRIVGERAPYGTLDRDLLALSKGSMYFGKIIANFILILFQSIILWLTITYVYSIRNYGSLLSPLLFIILISLFGIVLGLVISVFSKSKEQAIQIVPFIVLILFLFSGFFIGLDMPQSFKNIESNSPLWLMTNSLKTTMLDGSGFEDVTGNMNKLLLWIFGLTFIGLLKFKMEVRR